MCGGFFPHSFSDDFKKNNSTTRKSAYNMSTIYGLYIGEKCVYIGKTVRTMKERNGEHKSSCYNENSKIYESLKYNRIRMIGISEEQYYEYVKIQPIYSNIPENYADIMEDFTINLYRDFGYELWNDQQALDYKICIHGKQKQHCIPCGGTSVCIHKRVRRNCKDCSPVICNVCDKVYSKNSIKPHMKFH